MANQNGRNVAMPDENRPSWSPQDENQRSRRNMSDDDDRYMSRDRDEDRYWEDRSSRWDRDEGYRSTERYGQGQSGYGAGRYNEGDRSFQSRNMGYPSHMEERARERGLDERFSQGRGGSSWGDRGDRYEGRGGYLGQSGQEMGYGSQQGYGRSEGRWGNEGYQGEHQEGGMYGHGPGSWGQGDRNWQQNQQYGQGAYGQGAPGSQGRGMYGESMRGGSGYVMQRGGYGHQRWGNEGYTNQGMSYGSGMGRGYSGYNEGAQGGEQQQRYGSPGYQGWRQDQSHRGKGPSGYTRSDERIREMVCEALSDDHNVDATNIDVTVKNGEVILSGTVEDRMQKRMAEDCAEHVSGVKDVQNQIRIATERKGSTTTSKESETQTSSMTSDKKHRA